MKKYSQMTQEELHKEIQSLEAQKAAAEFESQAAVLDSKINFARAYALSTADFPPGLYAVKGYDLPMKVEYLNGVMAWGRMDGEEVSFPISLLQAMEI